MDEGLGGFSADVTVEVGRALSALLTSPGEQARERLRKATQRVCTEAHKLAISPERLSDVLRRLYDRIPLAGAIDPELRRAAYEQFIKGCISAYYDADDEQQT